MRRSSLRCMSQLALSVHFAAVQKPYLLANQSGHDFVPPAQ